MTATVEAVIGLFVLAASVPASVEFLRWVAGQRGRA